jgi:Holliday junction resolvasome RuvABC ATP-dependent DNA helicase subunit
MASRKVVKLMEKVTDYQESKGAQNVESHSTEFLLGGFLLLVNEAGFEPRAFRILCQLTSS